MKRTSTLTHSVKLEIDDDDLGEKFDAPVGTVFYIQLSRDHFAGDKLKIGMKDFPLLATYELVDGAAAHPHRHDVPISQDMPIESWSYNHRNLELTLRSGVLLPTRVTINGVTYTKE